MIKLAEDIDGWDGRKILIDPSWSRVLVEIASTQQIDLAIVDAETARRFDRTESEDDVEELNIDWRAEKTRQEEFEVEQNGSTNYLLIWNCYSDEPAVVAYRFTPLSNMSTIAQAAP